MMAKRLWDFKRKYHNFKYECRKIVRILLLNDAELYKLILFILSVLMILCIVGLIILS